MQDGGGCGEYLKFQHLLLYTISVKGATSERTKHVLFLVVDKMSFDNQFITISNQIFPANHLNRYNKLVGYRICFEISFSKYSMAKIF